jgi:hypothetical protein
MALRRQVMYIGLTACLTIGAFTGWAAVNAISLLRRIVSSGYAYPVSPWRVPLENDRIVTKAEDPIVFKIHVVQAVFASMILLTISVSALGLATALLYTLVHVQK